MHAAQELQDNLTSEGASGLESKKCSHDSLTHLRPNLSNELKSNLRSRGHGSLRELATKPCTSSQDALHRALPQDKMDCGGQVRRRCALSPIVKDWFVSLNEFEWTRSECDGEAMFTPEASSRRLAIRGSQELYSFDEKSLRRPTVERRDSVEPE